MKAQNDLTVGNPMRCIILFSIPIIAGNLFQLLYNIVDTMIVGHVLGEEAIAALGATAAIYSLYISMAYGMTNGFSVVIARYFGAKDERQLKKAVAHTIILSTVLSVVMTLIGVFTIRPVLIFLQTSEDILDMAVQYIYFLLLCFSIVVFYNMVSGILRGIGNSFMPLVCLIISSVVNVILDWVLVDTFEMGIIGAAIATIFAQFLSVVLCVIYAMKFCTILHVKREDFIWDKDMAGELFSVGISMGMMFSVVAVGSIALQSAINGLGTMTVAAHMVARKILEILMLGYSPLSVAASTYASQNLGAGKVDRIKKGMKATFIIAFSIAIISNIITFTSAESMVAFVSGSQNPELIQIATLYLKVNLPFYFALAILVILRSALQGIGRKVVPLIASTVELIGKFAVAWLLVPLLGYLGICICEPIIWIVCGLIVLVDFVISIKKLNVTAITE